MAGKLFLEKLLLKLKTGNSRSIHLNALPGRFARLDLYELINIWQGLHLRFINDLLSKPRFRFTITVDPKHILSKSEEEAASVKNIISRLNSLFYQQQDEFLEHGTQTFALGYPLLIKRDVKQPDKILKAPLLIWYLDIRKDLHKSNTWTISRNEESPVLFNEVLRSHIETNDRIRLDDLLVLLDEEVITEEKLSRICALMLEKLGTTSTDQDLEVKVLPGTNKEGIEKITQYDPWIRWSGIFGLYRTQKQSIIKDIEQFISDPANIDQQPARTPAEVEPTFPSVRTDPSQEFILTSLKEQDRIIIQGPPGTGKSQSLTAIITDALYHKQTCLVVCEKKTALDVIHANLAKTGLSDLSIIIDDVHRDRKKVVEKVRHLLEVRNELELSDFRHHEFEEIRDRFIDLRDRSSKDLKLINSVCFGDDSISDLVARVRKLNDEINFSNIKVDKRLFADAGYDRYKELQSFVQEGGLLFEPVGSALPYDDLHDSLFQDEIDIDNFFEKIRSAVETAKSLLETLNTSISESGALFSDHSRWNRWKVKVGSLFSGQLKKIATARKLIVENYPGLRAEWNNISYLDIDLPPLAEGGTLEIVAIPLRQLLDRLEPLLADKSKFSTYIPWRRYRISLDETASQILLALSRTVPLELWSVAFKHSYLSEFIRQYCTDNKLKGGLPGLINEFNQVNEAMLTTLPGKIIHTWSEEQNSILRKRTISAVKQLYNFRRNKTYGRRNSLRKMIHEDTELFSTAFPVVMVSPTVCSSIFPLINGLFDLVIFDEASQLRLEDTYAALYRGKKKVISGDRHQMPPSGHFMTNVVLMDPSEADEEEAPGISDDFLAESNSLLEYGMDTDYQNVFLDFHYRSHHPGLIAFSNAAFYGSRLVPMPARQSAVMLPPMEYFQVDGIYQKNRTNPEEAEAIVRYLFNRIAGESDDAPSVGIATFNINQRNFIWDLLIEQTIDDPLRSAQLDRLLEQGLFVKNLENIQGDERDIMLISTTFGKNSNGEFRQQFGPVTRNEGYRLLNVIITRARDKMVVFSSIPPSARSGFTASLAEKGNNGNAIFYSYLSYVEAVSKAEAGRIKNILEQVDSHCAEKPFQHESKRMPLFHQLIYSMLLERFGKDTVAHNFRFGGFILDLAIIRKGKPVVAISTNHIKQQTSTSYKMFLFKEEMLMDYGVKFFVADVLDWHADWEKEAALLIRFIDKNLQA